MGKFLKKFAQGSKKVAKAADKKLRERSPGDKGLEEDFGGDPWDEEERKERNEDFYDEVGIRESQKPESFHHFILENQYKDLERSIRGFKEVFNKDTRKWETKRKKEHCFTDEEAEEVLRTAQSHLATDIKLGYISKEAFPLMMNAIYKELAFLFESIAEYRYGRYNTFDKKTGKLTKVNFEKQYQMKLQNHKIFLELFTRVQANYSRAIQGQENKYTHESVKGQESLQSSDTNLDRQERYT